MSFQIVKGDVRPPSTDAVDTGEADLIILPPGATIDLPPGDWTETEPGVWWRKKGAL